MNPTEPRPTTPMSAVPATSDPGVLLPLGEAAELAAVREALAPEYELLGELGRGGMGVVYRARERRLDREVAIKVLPLALAMDASFVARFEQEAQVAAKLEHPNIIPIHRVGREGRVLYIVMKLLRGEALASKLERVPRLPPAEIRRILREVADALGYAARASVVHRDIKPENIVFDDRGHPVVTDFGIAKAAKSPNLTGTGRSIGTPQYMSPEQVRGEPLDGRSDLYSLGIVAYRCLVGHLPFDGDDAYAIGIQQLTDPIPRPTLSTAEEIELYRIIECLTAKNRDARYHDAPALIAALDGHEADPAEATVVIPTPRPSELPTITTGAARAARQSASPTTPPPARRWHRWVLAGVALLLVAGIGARRVRRHAGPPSACATRAGFDLVADPVGRIARGQSLDLRYDLCGLRAGTPYTLQVRISEADGTRRNALALTFNATSAGPRTRIHRTLGRVSFGPGAFRYELVATDAEGRARTQAQILEVVQP